MSTENFLRVCELEDIPAFFDAPKFVRDNNTQKITCIEFTNAKPKKGAYLSSDSPCNEKFHDEFNGISGSCDGWFEGLVGWSWRYSRQGDEITLMYCCNPTASDYEEIIGEKARDLLLQGNLETEPFAFVQRLALGHFEELAQVCDDTAMYYAKKMKERFEYMTA